MITELAKHNPLINQKIEILRNPKLQKSRKLFNDTIVELGELIGSKIIEQLHDKAKDVVKGKADIVVKTDQDEIVIAGILRAGLPLQNGLARVIDTADQAFIGARRKEGSENIEVDLSYIAGPDLHGKVLIVADTMLATGKSMVASIEALSQKLGQPKKLIVANVISSEPGLAYFVNKLPGVDIYTCITDPELDSNFYIKPGLGDAGDLLYGKKL